MPRAPQSTRLTATSLANHLACKHLTGLDRLVRMGELEVPAWRDPALELLRQRGIDHERAYVAHLRAAGRAVVDLGEHKGQENALRTLAAARSGADVIVQANLRDARFHGYADVLLRTDEASDLGGWSYDVIDTKLAQETRAGTLLQLCLYADLLRTVQGRPAERMHVVKPGAGFRTGTFRFAEFEAYYRFVRVRLEAFVDDAGRAEVYPAPVAHCDVCRWWKRCDERRHADDHLSLVAGMSSAHAAELERQGIATLAAFASAAQPLTEKPRRGSPAMFAKLQGQAAVQLRGRRTGKPVDELLPCEPGRGLARLPDPSPGDVYLDFEGDPYVAGGGLEYLTGFAYLDASGERRYRALWALDREREKRALEDLVDFVLARQRQFPALHVYHYAPYEPAALKRLAMRHKTREDELDTLLRGERFVDLYSVTRQGVRASVESYSLKPLEEVFGYEREVDLREEASPALRRVGCALEQSCPAEISADDRAAVEGYNRDDCLSLIELQRWLEGKRSELLASGADFERPPLKDGSGSEAAEERSAGVAEVFERLVAGLPGDPAEHTREESAHWLLAHLLEYFRREDKVAWWEYFARRALEVEELLEDRKALANLEFALDLGPQGRDRLPVHRYRFPPQEVSLSPGDYVHDLRAALDEPHRKVGTVHRCDPAAGLIDIKKSKVSESHHPRHVHEYDRVPPQPLDGSLLDLARWVAEHGIDAPGPTLRAGRDLLLRHPPRTRTMRTTPIEPDADPLATSLALARDLDGGLLAVQGPPGAGKTYTGARMILGLAREGRRVGISATSHSVIRNLLEAVLAAAREEGARLKVSHKPSSRGPRSTDPLPAGLAEVDKKGALAALDEGQVVGGVAWLWAASDLEGSLDYLFIDEAGQMSLAHVLACARSTENLVLLGDPQQLQQPQRGAHPEGAEISALNHLLGEQRTIPPELGIFLEETYRLPPSICAFTSEAFYEGRLRSRPHCAGQRLTGSTRFAGAGLFLVYTDHGGNQSVSPEEVETVVRAVDELLRRGTGWIDAQGRERGLGPEDLLVIAPYNAQVAALSQRLPELEVGTVDRFQGRERPVVLYSMTSSSAQDAPRGMSFLYDLHRLNVATSRAQCASIVVATRALFEPECRTPEQMRWANGVCRYRELARVVGV